MKKLSIENLYTHTLVNYVMIAMVSVGMIIGHYSYVSAEDGNKKHHANALWGKPKYARDFKHFDYVNPNAPKTGRLRMFNLGNFDTLNPYNIQGSSAAGLSLMYDSLMKASLDEPHTQYGLVAHSLSYPEDNSYVTFYLRKQAHFHDGVPIKPEDVIFSFDILKKSHPAYKNYYRDISHGKKIADDAVRFYFKKPYNKELRYGLGQLPILPKHYWTAKDEKGKLRDFSKQTLEIPVASGPYIIAKRDQPSRIIYTLNDDYWAKDLPVNKGQNNIQIIEYTGFLDETVALEAFKGGRYDFRHEYISKNWVKAYNIDPVEKGHILKETFMAPTPKRMQAFVMNLRRSKFTHINVRKALNLAFNFEHLNKKIFHGAYKRLNSFFESSVLAAREKPHPREATFLRELQKQYPQDVPNEVFNDVFYLPVNKTQIDFRKNLRQAAMLLKEAGWVVRDGKRVNKETGEQLKIEFLMFQDLARLVLPYIENLRRLGMQVNIRRTSDVNEYLERIKKFDFDVIVSGWRLSLSPGNELTNIFSSEAANQEGSQNLAGIQSSAIDAVIKRIIVADTYDELTYLSKSLDRLLLWNYYIIPQYYGPDRYARWNKFARSHNKPQFGYGFPAIWWYDEELAKTVDMYKQ